jgi:hypothetical protein
MGALNQGPGGLGSVDAEDRGPIAMTRSRICKTEDWARRITMGIRVSCQGVGVEANERSGEHSLRLWRVARRFPSRDQEEANQGLPDCQGTVEEISGNAAGPGVSSVFSQATIPTIQ